MEVQSQSSTHSGDSLQAVLQKLVGMEEKFESRFDSFDKKLEVLDTIPGFTRWIEENEKGLEEVKSELAELKRVVGDATDGACVLSTNTTKAVEDKLMQLEKNNAELSSRLAKVTTLRPSSSTDLVIGGLSVPDGTEPKAMVVAVLTTVHPDLEARDIISSRLLLGKSGKPGGAAAAVNTTHNAEPRANVSIPQIADASDQRPPSILVTLTSRPLMEAIIRDKARRGKLHTADLHSNLPPGLDQSKLLPGLININEFLPGEIFKLHRMVRQKAKQPGSGFTTYVRGGQIYVRRKKGEVGTVITSISDLDRFLGF